MSDTIERLRSVRVKRDAARAEAVELEDRIAAEDHEYLPYDKAAWHAHQGELDALEEEYIALAMELAEEVCR